MCSPKGAVVNYEKVQAYKARVIELHAGDIDGLQLRIG